MPKRHSADPFVRWANDTSNDDVGRDLGNLFRSVRQPDPMPPSQIEATRRKLFRTASRRPQRSAWPSIAIALSLLAGGASAALSEWARPNWWRPHTEALRRPEPETPPANVSRDLPMHEPSSAHESEEPAVIEPPIVEEPPARAAARVSPSAISTANSSAARSALALESESLERALVALRREHDGRSALVILDEHEAAFPRGELALEAKAARVDALLLLGRRAEALSQLERMPLEGAGPRAELLLVRAEIRADSDCARALPDFDKVLAKSPPPALEERALYGRAACRMRVGDGAGAEADLRTYLSRYPTGRFADPVRARLSPR
jgi:hypothetical protein